MRMIISMKKINSNNWALCSRALHAESPYILITNPPLVNVDNLYYNFYLYNNNREACYVLLYTGSIITSIKKINSNNWALRKKAPHA